MSVDATHLSDGDEVLKEKRRLSLQEEPSTTARTSTVLPTLKPLPRGVASEEGGNRLDGEATLLSSQSLAPPLPQSLTPLSPSRRSRLKSSWHDDWRTPSDEEKSEVPASDGDVLCPGLSSFARQRLMRWKVDLAVQRAEDAVAAACSSSSSCFSSSSSSSSSPSPRRGSCCRREIKRNWLSAAAEDLDLRLVSDLKKKETFAEDAGLRHRPWGRLGALTSA